VIGGDFSEHESREPVAEFSSVEKAEAYVEACRLAKPKRGGSFAADQPFRKGSLLYYYSGAEIESWGGLPHDPEL